MEWKLVRHARLHSNTASAADHARTGGRTRIGGAIQSTLIPGSNCQIWPRQRTGYADTGVATEGIIAIALPQEYKVRLAAHQKPNRIKKRELKR